MRSMKLAPLLAVVAALSVLGAACGGIEREPNLAKASERTTGASSFRMELHVLLRDSGDASLTTCTGAFDNARERGRFACAGPDRTTTFEEIYVGEEEYARLQDEERWVKSTSQGRDGSVSEEFSPERLLGMLQAASHETERLGEETVRGAGTVRYRLLVDCEEAELICLSGDAPVDVWIDDDGLVRRIELEQEGMEFDVEFFDFDVPLDIEPPPADQVTEEQSSYTLECDPGNERPIRVQQAIDVLGEHGFEMRRDEFGCSPVIAASLSSRSDDPQHLSCFVFVRRSHDSGVVVDRAIDLGDGGSNTPEPVERELENLDCTLFLERDSDEAVARLDAALAELKRAVRP